LVGELLDVLKGVPALATIAAFAAHFQKKFTMAGFRKTLSDDWVWEVEDAVYLNSTLLHFY